MDVREKLESALAEAVTVTFGDSIAPEAAAEVALVETPRDPSHGDFATSACLKLARPLKKNPMAIAEELAGPLSRLCEEKLGDIVAAVETAAPGFINFRLGMGHFADILKQAAAGGYGRSRIGEGISYNIEFVSANPTGPLTVAHGRQGAVGDALCNILEYAGFAVAREYYVNDTGRQIRLLGGSLLHFYAKTAGGEHLFPEDGYRGDYIAEMGGELFRRDGDSLLALPADEAIRRAGEFAAENILAGIRKDLEEFNVPFDVWFSQGEFEASGAVDKLMERLWREDLVYKHEGAVWLRASGHGDQKDRVVVRSDGTYTYRTPDIAYLENKFERGFDRAVMMVGPDHHGHLVTLEAAMRAMGHSVEVFHGLIVQFCALWRRSEKLKMSTRAGQFITLREVFDEVGIDATRYFFTARKTDAPLDFDIEFAKERSMENPVYYIQYVSARLSGVLENAAADERFAGEMAGGLFLPETADLSLLGQEEEPVLKALSQLTATIEKAAADLEPHKLCYWLHEFAGVFHNYYTRCRFVSDDADLSRARLYMASALKVMLSEILALIGVSAPDKM